MIDASKLRLGDLVFIDNEPCIFIRSSIEQHGKIFSWYTVLTSDGFLEEKSDVTFLFATFEPIKLNLYDDA
jgi:translation elongation factor P/translation initiation factor 5A